MGIGTVNPLFSLDVVGDVRVSNNIYVGGGIVISDKVNAFTEVTAPKMIASEAKTAKLVSDSIMMDSTKAIYGNTLIKGDVKVATDAEVLGDLRVNNKLTIQGNAKFNGLLTATQGLMFNDSIGFKWVNTNNTSANNFVLYYGKATSPPPPVIPNPCITPSALPVFQIGGAAQLIWNNTSLTLWADGANSIIDHQGNGGLLLNYNCGKDVWIGNANSGNLIVNQKVGIGTSNFSCQDPNVRLAVNGFVKSKEVIVEISNWCDNRLYPDFKRMSWKEKENYILQNHHLPEIESEEEIKEKGLYTQHVLKGIVANLEDHTMEIIELYKVVEQLKKENEELRRKSR